MLLPEVFASSVPSVRELLLLKQSFVVGVTVPQGTFGNIWRWLWWAHLGILLSSSGWRSWCCQTPTVHTTASTMEYLHLECPGWVEKVHPAHHRGLMTNLLTSLLDQCHFLPVRFSQKQPHETSSQDMTPSTQPSCFSIIVTMIIVRRTI